MADKQNAKAKGADTVADAKAKDTKKDAKKPKKPSIFARLAKYFRDVAGEFKKVVWPTKQQVIRNCIVVLVTILVFAVLVWGLDRLFNWLRTLLITAFTGTAA